MKESRFYLATMRMLEEFKKDAIKNCSYKGNFREAVEDSITEERKKYRYALKEEAKPRYLYLNDDGTGRGEIIASGMFYRRWKKVFFPGERWTDEEIQQFHERNWREPRLGSSTYTWYVKAFNVPSGVVAYIREARFY